MHGTSRQPGSPETLLPASWLKYLFPVLVGVGEVVVGILLDLRLGIENRTILYSDVFTGIVAGLLAFFLVRYYERLRRSDAERLHVAAEVNHHVRNALTTVLYSVHVKRDPELIQVTQDAVDRIDWALREVLWETDQHPSSAPDLPNSG
ncbi:MAG: hypothetical protein ACM3JB_17705 [Acidobacteriaceae bacterium]